MQIRKPFIVLLIPVFLALVLTGCPQNAIPVSGSAALTSSVRGATVSVVDAGTSLLGGSATTGEDGSWQAILVSETPAPFRVVVTGGTEGGAPFEGELSAYVPWNDPAVFDEPAWVQGEPVTVSLLTTFVDRLMQLNGIDYHTACELTAGLFEIPAEVDLASPEATAPYFSAEAFAANAVSKGGVEYYMAGLLARAGNGESLVMLPTNDIGVQVARISLARWGGEMLLGAVGGAIASEALGRLLPLFGMDTFDNDVRNNLAEIQAKLDRVQQDLEAISSDVQGLYSKLDLIRDQLVNEYARGKMDDYAETIEEQYMYLVDMYQPGMTRGNPTAVQKFVQDLRSVHDIQGCIYKINAALCGPPTQSTGALQAFTNLLITQLRQSDDKERALIESYNALNGFFQDMLGIQSKGVILVMNMLNYEAGHSGAKGYYGSADNYFNVYVTGYVEQETDTFLNCVEQLVAASADVRSTVSRVARSTMFPPSVKDVFASADWEAHRLCAKHPSGLVVRIIGDPTITDKIAARTPEFLKFSWDATRTSLGFARGSGTLIPQNGKTTRQWAPTLPDYFTTNYYLGWTRQGNGWRFQRQTGIAFAKVSYPEPFAQPPTQFRIYYVKFLSDFEELAGVSFEDPETGEPSSAHGTGDQLYMHVTVDCRSLPRFLAGSSDKKSSRLRWDATELMNAQAGELASMYTIKERYRGSGKYDGTAKLTVDLTNQGAGAQKIDLRYSLTSAVRTDKFINARKGAGIYGSWWERAGIVGLYHLGYKLNLLVDDEAKVTEQRWNYDRDAWFFEDASWANSDYTHTGSATGGEWQTGAQHTLAFRVDSNFVEADAATNVVSYSDEGSSVTFRHEATELELVPR